MAALIIVTTGTESELGFDAMSIPDYLAKLSPAAKLTLSRYLMGEARKLLEAENRHTPKPGFEDAAEHAVMSSDMHFDSVIDLDNAMCFTAFGMQVERQRAFQITEEQYGDEPNQSFDDGATASGWRQACTKIGKLINGEA